MSNNSKGLILIADDSKLVLEMLKTLFLNNNYNVITASDGYEAVRLSFTENPDVILLDLMMPYLNGYQICRLLKNDEQTKYIPIIMFTVKDKPIEKFWGIQTGADFYVTKDIDHGDLLEVVKDAIEQSRRPSIERPGVEVARPLTLLDILSKINDLLDKELYEAIIINKISALGKRVTNFSTLCQELVNLLKELISFNIISVTIANSNQLYFVLYSEGKVTLGDVNYIFEESSQKLEDYLKVKPKQINKILLSNENILQDVQERELKYDNKFLYSYVINSDDGIVCRFWFYGEQLNKFSEKDKASINVILDHVFVVLHNGFLFRVVEQLSITDELTGLYNRRQFFRLFESEMYKAIRYRVPFSVLLIDIDNFKLINDTYGHLAGDKILEEVAKIIKFQSRKSDIISRYGGEEFIIIAPHTELEKAVIYGERLRQKISEEIFYYKGSAIKVTVSIGVSAVYLDQEDDMNSIIYRADVALYNAKRQGKNRVIPYKD